MRRTARLLFCTLAMAGVTAAPARAQSLGPALGGMLRGSAPSSEMKQVCLDQNLATTYAAYLMGYHVFDSGGGERISIEKNNALAQEILQRATISGWSFGGWNGGSTEGRCGMHFALTLAPQDAAHFNNDPAWSSDVTLNLTRESGQWKVRSFEDAGLKAAMSGWLAVWRTERDRQPGGALRLAPPPSAQELQIKIGYARSCASHWEVSDDLFPAYNAWLDMLSKPSLLKFKVGTGARLEAGRLVAANDQAIVCRYNISTGDFSGRVERSMHDLDLRFTVAGGRPKWEVISFPSAPASSFTFAQVSQLMSHIYVDGKQLKPSGEADRAQSTGSQTYDWDAIVQEANR